MNQKKIEAARADTATFLRAYYGKKVGAARLADALWMRLCLEVCRDDSDGPPISKADAKDSLGAFKERVFDICISAMKSGDGSELRKLADAFEEIQRTTPYDKFKIELLKDPVRAQTSTVGQIKKWLKLEASGDIKIWRLLREVGLKPAP